MATVSLHQPVPFKVHVSDETLDWINSRVQTARIIPDLIHPPGEEWSYGIPTSTVSSLAEYWRESYDWRKIEEKMNKTFKMYTLEIEESGEKINLHFVHHRSERPGAVPLLFSHGWPGNFTEVENLLEPLTNPSDPAQQAFHVVAPSIPGFAFSSSPTKPGFSVAKIASLFNKLMSSLGYSQYLAQGGDWGSIILRALALNHPESCIGLHINFIVATPPSPVRHPLVILWLLLRWFTADQKKRLSRLQWWFKEEDGYRRIQGTKPQTVSYALQDSPIGMMAWIREKLEVLAEPDFVWDPDTVITWTMLYLIAGTAANASLYKEGTLHSKEEVLDRVIPGTVAVGYSSFPVDVGYIPKWWAEACVAKNIVFWKEHQKGGHFASHEFGEVFAQDIIDFAAAVKKSNKDRWDSLVAAGNSKSIAPLVDLAQ